MKKCSICLKLKPLDEFSKRKRVLSDGTEKVYPVESCKVCRNKKKRIKYKEDKNSGVRYIYRFINVKDDIIYIGKTNNLKVRIANHLSTKGHLPKECYEEVCKVEFMAVSSDVLMDIKELYYINLYKPKFNYIKKHSSPSFIISDFSNDRWVNYDEFDLFNIDIIKSLNRFCQEYDIKRIESIFKRKRGNKYLVYIQYVNLEGKTVQKRKASFDNMLDADRLVLDLKKLINSSNFRLG